MTALVQLSQMLTRDHPTMDELPWQQLRSIVGVTLAVTLVRCPPNGFPLLLLLMYLTQKHLIILPQKRRRLIQPRRRLRKMDSRPHKFDRTCRWMLTLPDKAPRLNLLILEDLADSINGTTGNTCRAQLSQPIIR